MHHGVHHEGGLEQLLRHADTAWLSQYTPS
jgi:hypothetical protein